MQNGRFFFFKSIFHDLILFRLPSAVRSLLHQRHQRLFFRPHWHWLRCIHLCVWGLHQDRQNSGSFMFSNIGYQFVQLKTRINRGNHTCITIMLVLYLGLHCPKRDTQIASWLGYSTKPQPSLDKLVHQRTWYLWCNKICLSAYCDVEHICW